MNTTASLPSRSLLDMRALDEFRVVTGTQRFQAIVGAAIQSYGNSARAMATLDADVVRREAHKVKGSASSLGLCRVATLAAALDSPTGPARLRALVDEFEVAITESARELAAIGILAQERMPPSYPQPLAA